MVGWLVDILVGWIVGSVIGGLVLGGGAAVLGAGGSGFDTAGVLIGTVLGIVLMRRARARRLATP